VCLGFFVAMERERQSADVVKGTAMSLVTLTNEVELVLVRAVTRGLYACRKGQMAEGLSISCRAAGDARRALLCVRT
jgi:hypothetical protein